MHYERMPGLSSRLKDSLEGDVVTRGISAAVASIARELKFQKDISDCGAVSFLGAGLEFIVCRAYSPRYGDVIVRSPWERFISNENDRFVDARCLMSQEAALIRHVGLYGCPVADVIAVYYGEKHDLMIMRFIPTDGTRVDTFELGRVVSALHCCPVPAITPVAQAGRSLARVIAERVVRRTRVLERVGSCCLSLPAEHDIERIDGVLPRESRLLHMDARMENVVVREGQIRALIDWSNCLIGPRLLELARIAEYQLYDDRFIAGYGAGDLLGSSPPVLEFLFRLDTAVMLGVVFFCEAPDRDRARAQLSRVHELTNALCLEYERGAV